jgi:hypothetical protein
VAAPTTPPTDPAATPWQPCDCRCHGAVCVTLQLQSASLQRWHILCRLRKHWADAAQPPRI